MKQVYDDTMWSICAVLFHCQSLKQLLSLLSEVIVLSVHIFTQRTLIVHDARSC